MTGRKKIAIIEDDLTIAMMYKLKFELEGFDVSVSSDSRNSIEMISEINPNVILLDINMPEMNGVEALKRIRKLPSGQDILVFVLTNIGKQEAPTELERLGIVEYIVKADMTPHQIVERVKNTLDIE